MSSIISDIHAVHCGTILSDHFPLFFKLHIQPQSLPTTKPRVLRRTCIDWSKVTPANIQNYCDMLSQFLVSLPSEVSNCVSSCCPHHRDALDFWAQNFVSTMLECASNCFPTITSTSARTLVGWKDSAGRLKEAARFWYKVWMEAGCPVSAFSSR